MKFQQYNPGNTPVSQGAPVLNDPGIEAASSDRRRKAFEALNTYSNNLRESRQVAEDNAFISKNQTDAQMLYAEQFQLLQKNRLNNPEGAADELQSFFETDIAERIKGARTEEIRTKLEQSLTSHQLRFQTQAVTWEHNRTVNIMEGNLNQQITDYANLAGATGARRQDVDGYIKQAQDAVLAMQDVLQAEKVLEMQTSIPQQMYGNYLQRAVTERPGDMLSELKSGAWDGLVPPKTVLSAIGSATAEVKRREAEYERRVAKTQERKSAMLSVGITDGTVNRVTLDNEYQAGKISPAKYASLVGKLQGRIDKESKTQNDIRVASTWFDGTGAADPSNPDDRKAYDTYVQTMIAQDVQNGADVREINTRLIAASHTTGLVDTQTKRTLQGTISNGTGQEAVAAAATIETMVNGNPVVARNFDQQTLNRAKKLLFYSRTIQDPERIMELVNESSNPINEDTRKAREAAFKQMDKTSPIAVDGDIFDQGFFSSEPDVPAEMDAQYKSLVKDFMVVENMTRDAAEESAMTAIQNRWGVSRIGGSGNRLMELAPERVYQVSDSTKLSDGKVIGEQEVNSQWMEEQAISVMREAGVEGETIQNGFMVEVNPLTRNTKTPGYYLLTKDDFGRPVHVTGADNQPITWRPDWKTSRAYKEMIKEQQRLASESKDQFDRDKGVITKNRIPSAIDRINRDTPAIEKGIIPPVKEPK